jgi:hypothetical protein
VRVSLALVLAAAALLLAACGGSSPPYDRAATAACLRDKDSLTVKLGSGDTLNLYFVNDNFGALRFLSTESAAKPIADETGVERHRNVLAASPPNDRRWTQAEHDEVIGCLKS